MTSGSINKLPDSLQWQIRTLLPRREGKTQAAGQNLDQIQGLAPEAQQGFNPPHCPSPINLAAAASMQLPAMPMSTQVGAAPLRDKFMIFSEL